MIPTMRYLLSLLVVLGASPLLTAQLPEPVPVVKDKDPASLFFRRVFVPTKDLPSLIKGSVPIRREEVESMIQLINRSAQANPSADQVRISSARYRARLGGEQLVAGEAQLQVERLELLVEDPPKTADKDGPAGKSDAIYLLPLRPMRLAIADAFWHYGEDQEPLEAVVGRDAIGHQVCLVPRPGRLDFSWSLKGRRDSLGELQFDLHLPASPTSQLLLELPANVTPRINRGIVSKAVVPAEDGSPDSGESAAPGQSETLVWILELGGHDHVRLTITPENPFRQREQLTFVRQVTSYGFTNTGLDVTIQLNLDVYNEPLRQLALELGELELLEARVGEQPVRWSYRGQPNKGSHELVLPEPILGQNHQLVIRATGKLQLSRRWHLPVVRLRNAFWREGEIQLRIPDDMTLSRLGVGEGQVTRVVPGEAGVETRVIQLHQPAADIEVVVERRKEEIQLETALEVTVLPPRVTARLTANLSSTYGSRFELAAVVSPGWIVESVETEPVSSIDSYDILSPGQDGSGGQLQLLLKTAVGPERPVQVIVRAHRVAGTTGMTGKNLQPLRFAQVQEGNQVVSIRVDPPFQLQLRRDAELQRLKQEDVTPEQATAVNAQGAALLYRHSLAADDLALFVRRIQPRYATEIAVQARIVGNLFQERYLVECTPRSSSLNRLLLHFSEPRDELIRWQIVDDAAVSISASKLSIQEQAGLGISGGETWELILSDPISRRFVLDAQRDSVFAESSRVSLLMLPEATSQLASLAILSADEGEVKVETVRLKSIPPRVIPVDKYAPIRSMYRYQPSLDSEVTISRESSDSRNSHAVVWQAMMQSRFTTNGVVHHRVSYFVENTGRRQIRFLLPGSLDDLHVLVDGETVAVNRLQGSGPSASISLPENQRYCTIQLNYREQASPLGAFTTLAARSPEPDCPVLDGRWELLLPAGYHPLHLDTGLSGERDSVSVGKRLFGPFWGQEDTGTGFVTDRSLPNQVLQAGPDQAAKVIQHLDALLLRGTGGGRPADWGELVTFSSQIPPVGNHQLWFDQRSVLASGVTPSTRIPDEAHSMSSLVRAFRLQLLVNDGMVVVTSAESPLLVGLPVQRNSDTLAIVPASRESFQERVRNHGLMNSRVWVADGELATIPWNRDADAASPGQADRHWNTSWHPLQVKMPVRMWVYNQVTMKSLAWAVFMLFVGLFSWLGLHRPTWCVRLAVASFALAMLAPSICYPFPTAIWLAALVTQLVAIFRQRDVLAAEKPRKEDFSFRLQLAPRQLLILFVFFGLLGLTATWGQEPEDTSKAASQLTSRVTVHRMLIPVDEENRPSGEYNFVPEEFFDELHRRSSQLTQRQKSWLIRSAHYVSGWEWSTDRQQLLDGVITATYQLEVLEDGENILLPIRADQVQVGDVLIDGQPVQLEISSQDRRLSFVVDQAGSYELSLRLTPQRQQQDGYSFIQFSIPAVSHSQLRLQLPTDAPLPQLPGCIGMMSHDEVSGQLVAELGPLDELVVRWPKNALAEPVQSQLEVQPSYWLRVRPNAVTLDAQFRFKVLAGSVKNIQLETDPRLRLVSARGAQFVAGQPRIRNDEQQTILLSLEDPQQQDFMLETTFYLNEASGIGNLQLPRLEVVADRYGDRLVAVTVSDQLDWQVDSDEMVQQMDVEQFVENWGSDEVPQRSFRVSEGADWNIATKDRLPRLSATESLDVHVRQGRLNMLYTADLEIGDGSLFQLQLESPEGFELQEVVLEQDGVQVPVRTGSLDSQGIVLFLGRPVANVHRLVVRGELAMDDMPCPVPVIRLRNTQSTESRTRVFRHHGVIVEFDKITDLANYRNGNEELVEGLPGRLVAEFTRVEKRADAPVAPAMLLVKDGDRDIRAAMVTRVAQQESQWMAAVECELTLDEAVIDQIRFEIPEDWAESIVVAPEMSFEIRQIPLQSRQHLILTPSRPLTGKARVGFAARLPAASGTFLVPDILLLDTVRTVRYLVLPARLEESQVQWATSGLQRISALPEIFSDFSVDDTFLVFQGILPDFEARISDVQQTGGHRQISLADIRVRHGQDGRFFGVATLDLEPSGSERVVVQVPPGCELVHANVVGVAAHLAPIEEDRFRLSLFSSQLPQRVELVFKGKREAAAAGSGTWLCDFPRLEDIPVVRTTWAILSNSESGLPEVTGGIQPISGTSIEVGRLDQLMDMESLSSELAAVSQPVSREDWYVPWQRQYQQAWKRLVREELRQEILPGQSQLKRIESRQQQIDPGVGLEEAMSDEETVYPPSYGDMFDALSAGSLTMTRFASTPGGAAPQIRFPGTQGSSPWATVGRWLLVLLVLAGIIQVRRNPILGELLGRWPFAWGALAGIAWWLLLSPPLVGILLMLLSAGGALRSIRGSWINVTPDNRQQAAGTTVTFVKR